MTNGQAAIGSLMLFGLILAAGGAGRAQDSEAAQEVAQGAFQEAAPAAQPNAPAPKAPASASRADEAAPKAAPTAPRNSAPRTADTAPSERTAVIAALDKRMGTTEDFTLKPGESFTFGRLSGVMQTCERTQPFERKQSGAFVQVTEQPPARANRPPPAPVRVFSGWLFAESPSLNPFIHPVYDVWLKSCTMRFPDGPAAPAASARESAAASGSRGPRPKAAD